MMSVNRLIATSDKNDGLSSATDSKRAAYN